VQDTAQRDADEQQASAATPARRPRWRRRRSRTEDDSAAIEYMNVFAGTAYAVLLALAIVVLWQNVDDLSQDIRDEAAGLSTLVWVAEQLPATQRDQLQSSIEEYVDVTLQQESPPRAGAEGGSRAVLATMRSDLTAFDTEDDDISGQRDKALDTLDDIDASGLERLAKSRDGFPEPLLVALIVLSLVVVSTPFTMGLRRKPLTALTLVVMTTLVACSLILVFELNSPFAGGVHSVDQSPLDAVRVELERAR